MGKGSRARPFEVPKDEFESNWERTFGKKDKSEDKPEQDVLQDNDGSEKTK